MTSLEMAQEFLQTMNPENVENGSANFAIYEFDLTSKYNLELVFIEEDFDSDDENNCRFKTAIDLTDKKGNYYDYTFVETMTDAKAIADGIDFLLEKWGVFAKC